MRTSCRASPTPSDVSSATATDWSPPWGPVRPRTSTWPTTSPSTAGWRSRCSIPALAGDESFLRRFRAEARAVAALNHPNILQVFDWGEEDGEPYLVLEYLAGGSLRQVYDTGALLTPEQAVQVGLEAAAGLDYAHRRGLVHRDIKPANLLFDADRRLRIADFGLARALAEAAWTEPDGAILGTARYAAPEQVEGWVLDGKADVYALALVLYEGVTGEAAFIGDTTVATLMARVGTLLPEHEALGPLERRPGLGGRPRPVRALRRRPARAAPAGARRRPARTPADPARRHRPSRDGDDDVTLLIGGAWDPVDATSPTRPSSARRCRPTRPKRRRRRATPPVAPDGRTERRVTTLEASSPVAVDRRGRGPRGRAGRRRRRPGGEGQVFTPSHPVPSLVGKSVAQAEHEVRPTTSPCGRPGHLYSLTAGGRAHPLASSPTARRRGHPVTAKEGSVIDVVVSAGLPPVTIPDLTSFSTCTDAVQALAAVHLVGVCPAVGRAVQLDGGGRRGHRVRRRPAAPRTARR